MLIVMLIVSRNIFRPKVLPALIVVTRISPLLMGLIQKTAAAGHCRALFAARSEFRPQDISLRLLPNQRLYVQYIGPRAQGCLRVRDAECGETPDKVDLRGLQRRWRRVTCYIILFTAVRCDLLFQDAPNTPNRTVVLGEVANCVLLRGTIEIRTQNTHKNLHITASFTT